MSDIVERLRAYGNPQEWAAWSLVPKLLTDAADEIDQLRAELDALRARIDGAPTTAHVYFNSHNAWVDCSVPTTWSGKRVALVPLDD